MTPEQIVAAIVRPLEWVAGEFPDEMTAENYNIWHEGHGFQVYHWSIVCGEPHPTLAAAQAAAEADYRARIASALDVEKIAALVEAAEEARWVDMLRDERDELLRQRNAAMTRTEAAEAALTGALAMVAAALSEAANKVSPQRQCDCRFCALRRELSAGVRALTPADAKAALDRLIAEAVAAETERCAKVAEDYAKDPNCIDGRGDFWAKSIAETIREGRDE